MPNKTNIGYVKFIGTIVEGYNNDKFQSGIKYLYKNTGQGNYDIYDLDGELIENISLRTFKKISK